MLNGIAPILIFEFAPKVNLFGLFSKIPLLESLPEVKLPVIPLYLDQGITGLSMDSQSRNIDLSTRTESLTESNPVIQTPLNSIITVNMIASRDSIGMLLLSIFADFIFSSLQTTSYSVSYLNQSVVLFGGKIHSYSSVQNANNADYFNVSLQIAKGNIGSTLQKLVPPILQPFNGVIPGGT